MLGVLKKKKTKMEDVYLIKWEKQAGAELFQAQFS